MQHVIKKKKKPGLWAKLAIRHGQEFLISLIRDLKQKGESERRKVLTDYLELPSIDRFSSSERQPTVSTHAQILRVPDRVERISSNNDRRKILKGFGIGSVREIADWKDRRLDDRGFAQANVTQKHNRISS